MAVFNRLEVSSGVNSTLSEIFSKCSTATAHALSKPSAIRMGWIPRSSKASLLAILCSPPTLLFRSCVVRPSSSSCCCCCFACFSFPPYSPPQLPHVSIITFLDSVLPFLKTSLSSWALIYLPLLLPFLFDSPSSLTSPPSSLPFRPGSVDGC